MWRAICLVLCHFIYNGLEHLRILVSAGDPGTKPLWIPRDLVRSQKLNTDFQLHGGQGP